MAIRSSTEKAPFDDPPAYKEHADLIASHTPEAEAPAQGMVSKVLAILQSADFCGLNTPKAVTMTDDNNHTDSRRRFIDAGSQSLTAQLDLYDLLSIRAWSGSLNLGIRPHPAEKDHAVPAVLTIESHSGSVNVNMGGFDVPKRDYSVSINSHSGSIGGSLIHGRKTSVVCHSGSVTLSFTLSGANTDASTLSTLSESGYSDITVLSPGLLSMASTSIKQLSSTHATKSGSLSLHYPSDWEGTIEGRSQSGGLTLHGQGIEIVQQGPHYVYAKKGSGSSHLSFTSASGSASCYFA
ncbi:hypothetical protein LTR53_010856 [Teratosphaeriaceae sp. CCFEE 6253]|nr:hypothetical protein LTR53_010856 [Teratosphaeriaceae sp. CCFEE 6253]